MNGLPADSAPEVVGVHRRRNRPAASLTRGGLSSASSPGCRVLMFDRASLSNRELRTALREGGFEVLAAYSATEVLHRQHEAPDVLVLGATSATLAPLAGLVEELRRVRPTPLLLVTEPELDAALAPVLTLSWTRRIDRHAPPDELMSALRELSSDRQTLPATAHAGSAAADALHWNVAESVITLRGKVLGLTLAQYRLLAQLLRCAGTVVPYSELPGGRASDDAEVPVAVLVHQVRVLLGQDRHLLRSVRGQGYLIDAPFQPDSAGTPRCLGLGTATIDLDTGEVRARGRLLTLAKREQQVLRALALAGGRAVPVSELLATVWADGAAGSKTVHTIIMRLRRRLEVAAPSVHITTLPTGYALIDSPRRAGAGGS